MRTGYKTHRIFRYVTIIFFFIFLCSRPLVAGQLFGILGKSRDDINFIRTASGCNEAAQLQGDRCELLGPTGSASARPQAKALKEAALSHRYDALAISVVMSRTLAHEAKHHVTVPIITFDSPFLAEDAPISQAYVGPNNLSFGRDLARLAKQFHPRGGTVFIMGDLHDPNLAERILGIRQELSGNKDIGLQQKLHGQGNWYEEPRSPWNAGDSGQESLLKLEVILTKIKPDVFISVGHWPILDVTAYRTIRARYHSPKVNTHIFIGVGEINASVMQLLDDGQVDGFVKIDFHEIGKACYQTMRALVNGKPIQPTTFVPNEILHSPGTQ